MKQYIKDLSTKKFWVYFTRWQISAWVMLPVMTILAFYGLPLWLNLMIGQAFGALIFWKIDQWIFLNHKTDNVEDTIDKISTEITVSDRKL